MAVEFGDARFIQKLSLETSGYLFAIPLVFILGALLLTICRPSSKLEAGTATVVTEPLMPITESSQKKKRTQRQRKKARREALALAAGPEVLTHEDTSFEVGDERDVEAADDAFYERTDGASDMETDLEAATTSAKLSVRNASPILSRTSRTNTYAPEVEPDVPTVLDIQAGAAKGGIDSSLEVTGSNARYDRHLLLMHRDVCRKIARGPPGLERDEWMAKEKRQIQISAISHGQVLRVAW